MAINNLYILGVVGAAGVIGGGVYLAYPSSNSPTSKTVITIRDRLERDKYILLSREDDTNWNKVLGKYNEAGNSSKRFYVGTETLLLSDLKRECESFVNKEGDDGLYEKAKLWCTVPRTVQERLKDLGVNILKTEGEDDNTGDKSKWNNLKNLYKNAGDRGVKGLTLTNPDGDDSRKQLRDECKKHLNKERWDAEYDYYLGKVSDWCSNKG